MDLIPPLPPNPKGQAELIIKSFGLTFLKPKFFNVDTQKMAVEQDAMQSDTKAFGLPVFDSLKFDELSFTSNEGDEITLDAFSMSVVLCEISQTRNVVTTQIAGRNGTVKEYIGDGDFQICIKGMLASQYQNSPPSAQLNALMKFCTAPAAIPVVSNFLNYFKIYNLVIETYTFRQLEGTRNMIPFELNCLSEPPVEITGSNQASVASFI